MSFNWSVQPFVKPIVQFFEDLVPYQGLLRGISIAFGACTLVTILVGISIHVFRTRRKSAKLVQKRELYELNTKDVGVEWGISETLLEHDEMKYDENDEQVRKHAVNTDIIEEKFPIYLTGTNFRLWPVPVYGQMHCMFLCVPIYEDLPTGFTSRITKEEYKPHYLAIRRRMNPNYGAIILVILYGIITALNLIFGSVAKGSFFLRIVLQIISIEPIGVISVWIYRQISHRLLARYCERVSKHGLFFGKCMELKLRYTNHLVSDLGYQPQAGANFIDVTVLNQAIAMKGRVEQFGISSSSSTEQTELINAPSDQVSIGDVLFPPLPSDYTRIPNYPIFSHYITDREWREILWRSNAIFSQLWQYGDLSLFHSIMTTMFDSLNEYYKDKGVKMEFGFFREKKKIGMFDKCLKNSVKSYGQFGGIRISTITNQLEKARRGFYPLSNISAKQCHRTRVMERTNGRGATKYISLLSLVPVLLGLIIYRPFVKYITAGTNLVRNQSRYIIAWLVTVVTWSLFGIFQGLFYGWQFCVVCLFVAMIIAVAGTVMALLSPIPKKYSYPLGPLSGRMEWFRVFGDVIGVCLSYGLLVLLLISIIIMVVFTTAEMIGLVIPLYVLLFVVTYIFLAFTHKLVISMLFCPLILTRPDLPPCSSDSGYE